METENLSLFQRKTVNTNQNHYKLDQEIEAEEEYIDDADNLDEIDIQKLDIPEAVSRYAKDITEY